MLPNYYLCAYFNVFIINLYMTKSELVKQISYSTGIDYATALTVVEATIH